MSTHSVLPPEPGAPATVPPALGPGEGDDEGDGAGRAGVGDVDGAGPVEDGAGDGDGDDEVTVRWCPPADGLGEVRREPAGGAAVGCPAGCSCGGTTAWGIGLPKPLPGPMTSGECTRIVTETNRT